MSEQNQTIVRKTLDTMRAGVQLAISMLLLASILVLFNDEDS